MELAEVQTHEEHAMTVVKAAAVQLSPVLYSREATVAKARRTILELGQQPSQ
jgi:aliphatic nitrilase